MLPVDRLAGQVAWVACCGGMALLPDLDHESSTAARMWGPLSRLLAGLVVRIGQGHRGATHDVVVAPVVLGGAAYLASFHRWAAMVVLALAIGLALRACHFVIPGEYEKSWPINLLASAAGAWWLVDNGAATHAQWLPYAVAVGVLVHIVGDSLTEGSVPIPFSWLDGKPNRMGKGPLTTGRWYEHLIASGLLIASAFLLYLHIPQIKEIVDTSAEAIVTTLAGLG